MTDPSSPPALPVDAVADGDGQETWAPIGAAADADEHEHTGMQILMRDGIVFYQPKCSCGWRGDKAHDTATALLRYRHHLEDQRQTPAERFAKLIECAVDAVGDAEKWARENIPSGRVLSRLETAIRELEHAAVEAQEDEDRA